MRPSPSSALNVLDVAGADASVRVGVHLVPEAKKLIMEGAHLGVVRCPLLTERPDLVSGGERARVTDDDRRLQGSAQVSVVMLFGEGFDRSEHLSHVGLG